jgi:hypothetical protein
VVSHPVKWPGGFILINKDKEKTHVVDNRSHSGNPVVARRFWWKTQLELPQNRELGSRPDRNCCDPHHSKTARIDLSIYNGMELLGDNHKRLPPIT